MALIRRGRSCDSLPTKVVTGQIAMRAAHLMQSIAQSRGSHFETILAAKSKQLALQRKLLALLT